MHGLTDDWADVEIALEVDAERLAGLFLDTLGPGPHSRRGGGADGRRLAERADRRGACLRSTPRPPSISSAMAWATASTGVIHVTSSAS